MAEGQSTPSHRHQQGRQGRHGGRRFSFTDARVVGDGERQTWAPRLRQAKEVPAAITEGMEEVKKRTF